MRYISNKSDSSVMFKVAWSCRDISTTLRRGLGQSFRSNGRHDIVAWNQNVVLHLRILFTSRNQAKKIYGSGDVYIIP